MSTPNLASGGPARLEEDSGLDTELGFNAPCFWFQWAPSTGEKGENSVAE